MIRKAVLSDIPQLIDLAVEALSIDPYPGMPIDRERVYHAVKSCVTRGNNYGWVAEHEGVVRGALGAEVVDNLFHEKQQAIIYMWFCKHPGDGARLMRNFLQWCDSRPQIKQIIYTGERMADPRVGRLAQRLGLNEILPMYIKTR